MRQILRIGLDIAKRWLQVHAVDEVAKEVFNRKLGVADDQLHPSFLRVSTRPVHPGRKGGCSGPYPVARRHQREKAPLATALQSSAA